MPIKLTVSRAELTLEAVYVRPEFNVAGPSVLTRLFERLQPYGLRLADMRLERGTGTLSEFHVLGYLLDFLVTLRVRIDRVEVFCPQASVDNVNRLSTVVADALKAVQSALTIDYQTYSLSMNLHGSLEGQGVREYMAQFVASTPEIGVPIGNAVAYYYGPEEDRLVATITLDKSLVTSDGLYVRPQATWDAKRVSPQDLPTRAEQFVRLALDRVGLETPVPR